MKLTSALLMAFVFSVTSSLSVHAQDDLDVSGSIKMLKPKPLAAGKKRRKIDPAALEAAVLNQIVLVPKPKKNAASPDPQNVPVAPELADLPSAEIAINFERNSSRVLPKSFASLAKLAIVLNDQELKSSRFLVAGHTDAKGSNALNQALSKKRAEAVRKILIDDFDVASSRVISIGFGEEKLKNSNEPESAANRRVEIINIGSD